MPGKVFFLVKFLPFSALNIYCQSLVACNISAKKADSSLVCNRVFFFFFSCCFYNSVYFNFGTLTIMCPGTGFLGFILFGTFLASWTWTSVFFLRLVTISSNRFSVPISLLSPYVLPIMQLCWYAWYYLRGPLKDPHF